VTLESDTQAARTAADESVKAGDPPEQQQQLAEVACALEEKLRFQDWVKIQEDAGYTVVGDTFETAMVDGVDLGPTYNDKPGEVVNG